MQGLEFCSTRFQELNGEPDQIPTVIELKFFLEVGAMCFDGLDTAVEFFGNLAGAETEPDQVQDFKLAFAQAGKGRRAIAARRRQPLRQDAVHHGAEVNISRQNLLYGQPDILGTFLLHEVAIGARTQCAFREQGFVMHAHSKYREFRVALAQDFDQPQARVAIERNVDNGHRVVARRHGRQCLLGVGRMAAKQEAVLIVEQLGHAFAHDGMVVNHQDAGFSVPACLVLVAAHAALPFGPDK